MNIPVKKAIALSLSLLCLVLTIRTSAQEKKVPPPTAPVKKPDTARVTKLKPVRSSQSQKLSVSEKKTRLFTETRQSIFKSERPKRVFSSSSKKIIKEFTCSPGATVTLLNNMWGIHVLPATDNTIRLVATIYYEGEPSLTNDQWLEKAGINITGTADNVKIETGNFEEPVAGARVGGYQVDKVYNSRQYFDSTGQLIGRQTNQQPSITLYVPNSVMLTIQSKFAEVSLEKNLNAVEGEITNGTLILPDMDKAIVKSRYAHIRTGNIREANLEIVNGDLVAKDIDILQLTSRNATIELGRVGQLTLSSQADQVYLEKVRTVQGKKDYGDFRINSVSGAVDLSGKNTDLRITRIDATASSIAISTRFASLRLPVTGLSNYQVLFEGKGGLQYAPFAKTDITPTSFKAMAGPGKTAATQFELTCDNCSIDFN